MARRQIYLLSLFLLLGCFPVKKESNAGFQFALSEEEIKKIKFDTFQKVLHRPHPAREKEMIALLPKEASEEIESQQPKRFVSEDGFPLISFQGGPMTLGEALTFIAGSAGYRVELGEGVNRALPVATTFTDTPLDKAVAALLEPFSYSAVVDGKKGTVTVSLIAGVELQEAGDPGKKENRETIE